MAIIYHGDDKPKLTHPDAGPDTKSGQFIDEHSSFLIPTYHKPSLLFVRGEGSHLYDAEGRDYLDFGHGFSVTTLGHANPDIVAIVADQATKLLQPSSGFHNEHGGPLAKLLVERTREAGCMPGVTAACFLNSGAEAVDAAIKHARRVGFARDPSGRRHEVVYFNKAFHGMTMGALSATPGKRAPFEPLVPGFRQGVFNDVFGLDELITERTCGVLVEPIQGVGGVVVATEAFLVAVARRCREVGAVLIHDEVQSGMGRSGTFWAHAVLPPHAHPDVLVFAKAIGNGYPMGGVLVTDEVRAHLRVGDTGSTLGGNPLACRIGRYTVERCSDAQVLAGVRAMGEVMFARIGEIRRRFPTKIVDVRGRGAFIGVEMAGDPQVTVDEARQRGLLVLASETNAVRILPGLLTPGDEVARAMDIFEKAVEASEWTRT